MTQDSSKRKCTHNTGSKKDHCDCCSKKNNGNQPPPKSDSTEEDPVDLARSSGFSGT